MKNEKKLQALCEQLSYGIKVLICDPVSNEKDQIFELDKNAVGICENKICIASAINTNLCFPILHEMDLTKPITIGGETFVPIQKLVELERKKNPKQWIEAPTNEEEIAVYEFQILIYSVEENTIPHWMCDLLNEWHFNWRNLPESDYVKVSSLPKSPYV